MRHPVSNPVLLLTVLLSLSSAASAAEAPHPTAKPATTKPSPAPKSQFNTQIFEKEDQNVRFSDTVKLVRDLDGNTEILFMKRGGIYQSPNDSSALARLIESQRDKTPVNVTVDEASQKIMSVMPAPRGPGPGGGGNGR